MAQECAELRGSKLARMALAVEEYVAADPLHVRLLSADAVVLYANDGSHVIEQAAAIGHGKLRGCLRQRAPS